MPASCIVFFIQRPIVSLEAALYGLSIVKNKTVLDDRDSFIPKLSCQRGYAKQAKVN